MSELLYYYCIFSLTAGDTVYYTLADITGLAIVIYHEAIEYKTPQQTAITNCFIT